MMITRRVQTIGIWDKPALDLGRMMWPVKEEKLVAHIQFTEDHDRYAQMMVEGRMKIVTEPTSLPRV